MIANATGCSSIYSGSVPSTPYCTDEKGYGPAWANSLFEDFAEFGLGMKIASEKMRTRVAEVMKNITACDKCSDEIKALAQQWLDNPESAVATREVAEKIVPLCEACNCDNCKALLDIKGFIMARSQWIIAATVPLTTSASVVSTTCSLQARTSTFSYSIPKFTQTPVVRLQRLPRGRYRQVCSSR